MKNFNLRTIAQIAALTGLLLGLTACGGTPATSTKVSAAQSEVAAQANARATLAYVNPKADFKSEALKPAGVP